MEDSLLPQLSVSDPTEPLHPAILRRSSNSSPMPHQESLSLTNIAYTEAPNLLEAPAAASPDFLGDFTMGSWYACYNEAVRNACVSAFTARSEAALEEQLRSAVAAAE